MATEPKYITENGVMKKNPKYIPEGGNAPPKAQGANALAVMSTPEDVLQATEIQSNKNGISVPLAPSTVETVEMLQDEEMLKLYKSRLPLDGGQLLDSLGKKFERYETPLGMVNKLMMLTQYKLDFLIDDSGSMASPTDVDAIDATEPMKSVIRQQLGREPRIGEKMSRIQEAEDRLHIILGILAYIPIETIQIRFLNDKKVSTLDRTNKTPEEFEAYAHKEIRDRFANLHLGGTPVRDPLNTGFNYSGKWSHYLFNDGEPNEGGSEITKLIAHRKNPENHPLTLISCTDNDKETEWMKKVDSSAPYVAEVDDYCDERDEVQKKQGEAFPFTRGLWILCQIVAAINPYDLDALDETLPLTNYCLSNILGRKLNPNEYQYYFQRNPNAFMYVKEYGRFLNEEVFSRQIISTKEQELREKQAGYIEGERPNRPLDKIESLIAPTTLAAQKIFESTYSANKPVFEPPSQPQSALTSGSMFNPQIANMPANSTAQGFETNYSY